MKKVIVCHVYMPTTWPQHGSNPSLDILCRTDADACRGVAPGCDLVLIRMGRYVYLTMLQERCITISRIFRIKVLCVRGNIVVTYSLTLLVLFIN